MMRRIKLATAALVMLLGVPHITEAGQVYTISNDPADQNGATLTGTVTTDGKLGALSSSDITAWSWTISAPSLPSFTLQGTNEDVKLMGLIATDKELLLPAITSHYKTFELHAMGSAAELVWYRGPKGGDYEGSSDTSVYWQTASPAMGGNDPWVIGDNGVVGPAGIPEPSTLVLAGLAAVCVIAHGLERRFRTQRKATTEA